MASTLWLWFRLSIGARNQALRDHGLGLARRILEYRPVNTLLPKRRPHRKTVPSAGVNPRAGGELTGRVLVSDPTFAPIAVLFAQIVGVHHRKTGQASLTIKNVHD